MRKARSITFHTKVLRQRETWTTFLSDTLTSLETLDFSFCILAVQQPWKQCLVLINPEDVSSNCWYSAGKSWWYYYTRWFNYTWWYYTWFYYTWWYYTWFYFINFLQYSHISPLFVNYRHKPSKKPKNLTSLVYIKHPRRVSIYVTKNAKLRLRWTIIITVIYL